MPYRYRHLIVATLVSSLLIACSDSKDESSSSSTSTSAVNTALTKMKSAVPDVSDGVSFTEFSNSDFAVSPMTVGLSSHLSKSNFFYPGDNGGTEITPAAFLEALLSDSLSGPDDAVFKRANTAFLVSCAIDTLSTTGDNLYSTSQTSVTMNASKVKAACGEFSDLDNMDGKTIGMTITNLSDTTNYDQKIEMLSSQGSNSTMFGSTTNQYIYVRNNSSVLSFAHVETNSGSSGATVSYIYYDKSTQSGRFQYASTWGSNSKHFYRILVDVAANQTTVLTQNTQPSSKWIRLLARSTASSQTQAAMSLSWNGLSTTGGASASATDASACLNISGTASVTTDNSLACSGGPTLTVGASDADTLIGTTFGLIGAGKGYSDIAALATTATGAAYAPSFTSTTITSAAMGF